MTDASNPIGAVRARLDGGAKWLKGNFVDGEQVCIAQACKVIHHNRTYLSVRAALGAVISEQYPERLFFRDGSPCVSPVPNFNDHPDTTWADVDLVLDKAARRWDEQVRP